MKFCPTKGYCSENERQDTGQEEVYLTGERQKERKRLASRIRKEFLNSVTKRQMTQLKIGKRFQ